MRSTSTGATPFDAASPPVRLTYLEEPARDAWACSGALLAQRYELEAQDATHAPGNLWQARQLRSRRPVTVQLLDPAIVEDAVLMETFLHEASLAAAIDHPNVVRLLDYGIDYELEGGMPFLVLEPLAGETLEQRLARQPRLSRAQLAPMIAHAALGLEALHGRGLVHRRLNPAHLLVSDEVATAELTLSEVLASGSVRAGGFTSDSFSRGGLALRGGASTQLLVAIDEAFRESLCLVHKLAHQLSWPRAVAANSTAGRAVRSGAPAESAQPRARLDAGAYQSPEQLLGHGPVDPRSDLWSLAVIVFEALTGTPAFSGATLGERLVRICSGEPNPPPADLALPPGFSAWFRQGVRKLPSERFASARQMSDAFLRLLDT